jgi:hypothetical protein
MHIDTFQPSPAPLAHVAGTAKPTEPKAKAPRFYRATAARFNHPKAPHVKGVVLIGSAWPIGARGPTIFAQRIYTLPMGDSFNTNDAKAIIEHLSDDSATEFFALAVRHGQSVDDYITQMLDRLGLDVPQAEEPAGSFSTANLIAWSK